MDYLLYRILNIIYRLSFCKEAQVILTSMRFHASDTLHGIYTVFCITKQSIALTCHILQIFMQRDINSISVVTVSSKCAFPYNHIYPDMHKTEYRIFF